MNRLLGIVIGLVVAASLAPAAHVRADGSTVGGTLTGDTHWTLAGSPYVFSANVILATGATLTIDPGVTVLANAHALYLQGKVTAVGTPTDPIVMDHAVEIVFYPGAEGSAFAWTEFRSMFDYVRPDQNTYGPLPSLAHVWFNGGRGLYFYYPHAGTVTDTYTFSDARFTGGAEVGGCCSSWSGSRLSIEGGGVITAYSNSIGITISDSNILPKAGSCGSAAGLGCAIGTFTGTMPITATNNWWGTTDRAAIDAAIYDGLDQPGQPVVSVDPIRTGPLDLNGPTTQIDPAVDPAGGPLTGTAADNPLGATGVASVVASVRDTVTGDWWNGVAWAPSETFLPATGTTTWSLPLPTLVDGRQYAVRSHATDVAGNHQWGTTQASVWADGTPPSGSVEILSQQGSGQWSSDPNVVVYQHVTNPGAGGVVAFRYSLDGVTWRQASSWVDDFAVDLHDASIGGSNSEGPRSVWVEWQDSHGLWSAPASDSIILDTTPPDGSATVNSGVASTSSVVVPVRVDATDATTWVAGAWLSNDGTHWVNVPIGNDIAWDLSANGGTGAVGAHTVWWKVADGPGNESPSAGISLALDANVPLVSTPSVPAMVVPQTAGHASASLHSAWAGAATAGISGYDVERSVARGPWTLVANQTATSLTQAAAFGSSVRFRIRAVDADGNLSAWVYTASVTPALVQQTSSAITWKGTWHKSTSSGFLGGSARYATASGASASYRFTGRAVAWVAAVGPRRGRARVYIDGIHVKTVDLHASSRGARRILFAKTWSSAGTHTIKIVVAGTAGHARVDVDGFVRLN